jgi:ribosomal protein L40E
MMPRGWEHDDDVEFVAPFTNPFRNLVWGGGYMCSNCRAFKDGRTSPRKPTPNYNQNKPTSPRKRTTSNESSDMVECSNCGAKNGLSKTKCWNCKDSM